MKARRAPLLTPDPDADVPTPVNFPTALGSPGLALVQMAYIIPTWELPIWLMGNLRRVDCDMAESALLGLLPRLEALTGVSQVVGRL